MHILTAQKEKTIIPVFHDIYPGELDNLLNTHTLMRLSLLQHVMYDDPGFMRRIISTNKQPDICESLILITETIVTWLCYADYKLCLDGYINPSTLKYFCLNHGDQRVF